MSAAATTSERYRPEVVARLLASHAERGPDEAPSPSDAAPARRARFVGAHALRWLGGAALVAGLAGLGAWTSASSSARAAPPPRIEVPEIVVTAAPALAASSADTAPPAPPAPPLGVLADGRVVLNVATEEELTKLPSVGPSRAKAIVALRGRLGKFRQMSELLRVKGIGRKTLAKISARAVLDAPPG